jgi:hypothetical protein
MKHIRLILGIVAVVALQSGPRNIVQSRSNLPGSGTATPVRYESPVAETVDLKNSNLHMEIPIRASHQKTAAPLSRH